MEPQNTQQQAANFFDKLDGETREHVRQLLKNPDFTLLLEQVLLPLMEHYADYVLNRWQSEEKQRLVVQGMLLGLRQFLDWSCKVGGLSVLFTKRRALGIDLSLLAQNPSPDVAEDKDNHDEYAYNPRGPRTSFPA